MKMFSSLSLRCLLLLLLSLSASISCSSAAQRDSKLRLLLHRTPLLSSKQDSSRSLVAQLLLSDLLQMENEALEEDGFALPDGEPEGWLQELLLEDLHVLLSLRHCPPPPPLDAVQKLISDEGRERPSSEAPWKQGVGAFPLLRVELRTDQM
ncbi:hypothetical protein ILYODFUR_013359 [Ilyodon furcidens]|uniref:Uncharacterized protein n=1 Tax=Ilyodon furcidens TaxID=33524 RepID=A0ABV0SM43_9TELE